MTLHLFNSRFEKLVRWFYEQHLLDDADIYPVDLLARRAGEARPEVLCALAFCLRAARQGHTGLWLGASVEPMFAAELEDDEARQALAAKLVAAGCQSWPELLADSPLVSAPGAEARPAASLHPFVLLDEASRPGDDGASRRLVQLKYYHAEQAVAAGLLERLGSQEPAVPAGNKVEQVLGGLETTLGLRLEEQKRRAVKAALSRRLVVLTGGPGTGKTFTLGLLLRAWFVLQDREPPSVALAAPTGKAADRMRQAMSAFGDAPPGFAQFLEANRPRTLHRLLEAVPGRGFRRGAERKLPHRLVIVDEASMVDLLLMRNLLAALPDDAHLVLVGDAEQLASVEVGCVFGDVVRGLKEDDYRVIRLQRVHRTEGDGPLARLAELVRDLGEGHSRPAEVLDFLATAGAELELVETAKLDDEVVEKICRPYGEYLKTCAAAAAASGWPAMLQALSRYRVLAPFRRGPHGVDNLNRHLQGRLAANYRQSVATAGAGAWFDLTLPWYPGRAVMVTENRYDLNLFNGDVGAVVLEGGRPLVVFPDAGGGDEPRRFLPAQLPAAETVFATTVHKAQGSEFDEVAVVLPQTDHPLLTRELVYTAITRARCRLRIFATKETLTAALSRPIRRASGLAELLAEGDARSRSSAR